jgi:L-aspartate semialdehyde sulfurtransferase ferredoxin
MQSRTRLSLQIPPMYREQPILSDLVNLHDTQLNILGASLALDGQESGWFDVELSGSSQQVDLAICHLQNLEVTIWNRVNLLTDNLDSLPDESSKYQSWQIDF